MDQGKIKSGDIQLHYVADGPADGEPVVLLHGFPEFSYEWRHQIKALAAAGYRAVAPDLRGYNLSDRPEGIENYRMRYLIQDVAAVIAGFGWSKANIVCHDWGGSIGWLFAGYQPQMVNKFVAINTAHPAAFRKAQNDDVEQLQKSWYIWFFQDREAPERYFGGENIDRFVNWAFRPTDGKKVFNDEDLAIYRKMLSQPGQLTAAINYYRANSTPQNLVSDEPVKVPLIQAAVLLIYGEQDSAFSPKIWEATKECCAGAFRKVALAGVSHWEPEEAPDEINRLILEHFNK